jgi:hypothetical protein
MRRRRKMDQAEEKELELGREEHLQKAKNSLDDAINSLEHAIAVQYLIDQGEESSAHSRVIAEEIDEMIEELAYLYKAMDDPGEESYGEMTKAFFEEKVRVFLCSEGIEAEGERQKSIRERKERGEKVFENEDKSQDD